jgi:hypothetical protein
MQPPLKTQRCWSSICQFPGKKKFHFGTVVAEKEMEAFKLIEDALQAVFPSNPVVLCILPGMVVFIPQSE